MRSQRELLTMNSNAPRQHVAGIKMWLILNYYRDLTEFYAGDEGRFSRMVVEGGKSLPSAHPSGWVQHIINCTTAEVIEFHHGAIDEIYAQLRAWGHDVQVPERGQE